MSRTPLLTPLALVIVIVVGVVGFLSGAELASRPGPRPVAGSSPSSIAISTPLPTLPPPRPTLFADAFQPDVPFASIPGSTSCMVRDTSVAGEPSAASGRALVRTWLIVCPSTVHLAGDRRQTFVDSIVQSLPGSTGWSGTIDEAGFETDTLPYLDGGLDGTITIAFSPPTQALVIAITLEQAAPP